MYIIQSSSGKQSAAKFEAQEGCNVRWDSGAIEQAGRLNQICTADSLQRRHSPSESGSMPQRPFEFWTCRTCISGGEVSASASFLTLAADCLQSLESLVKLWHCLN